MPRGCNIRLKGSVQWLYIHTVAWRQPQQCCNQKYNQSKRIAVATHTKCGSQDCSPQQEHRKSLGSTSCHTRGFATRDDYEGSARRTQTPRTGASICTVELQKLFCEAPGHHITSSPKHSDSLVTALGASLAAGSARHGISTSRKLACVIVQLKRFTKTVPCTLTSKRQSRF